jgi:cleavage stimulation factor subunit 3
MRMATDRIFQAPAQIKLIDHYLVIPGQFKVAEELFKKYLRTSPSVELWKHYLVYVR